MPDLSDLRRYGVFGAAPFSLVLVKDDPKEDDESESEEDESESARRHVAFLLAKDGARKVVTRTVQLVADGPNIQKLLDVHNNTHHPM